MEWVQAAKDFGVPVAFLALIAWGFFQFCKWAAPRLDRLLDGQLNFMQRTGDAIAAQTPKVDAIHEMVSDLHSDHVAIPISRGRQPKKNPHESST